MSNSSWVSFSRLLEREGGKRGNILPLLSPSEQEKLSRTPTSIQDPFERPLTTEARIERIHYSWMISFLEPFAERDKRTILAALSKPQAKKLAAHFNLKESSPPLKGVVKDYLTSALYEWLISDQRDFLPVEFLPDHPLNPLLDLSKEALQRLADYLGLHDLAIELKHVIKSQQIKKIQQVLKKEEQAYLKRLLKEKEPLTFARLNLDGWNGDGEKLKAILHHRGFNRLAKALFGCHPSLLWHLTHRLDTGRTKILRKYFTDIKNETAHAALVKQIQELIPKVQG
ncbi:MAG: hypothetical protein KDK60_01995 [Chlamydiia bacterium]|nr:hypothetical protein [Chlamydiia bacterium]